MPSTHVLYNTKRKIPIWVGNTLETIGLAFGILSLLLINPLLHPLLKLVLLLVAWFCFWFFSHCLAHFIIGKILGVHFLFYFVSRSSLTKLNLPFISSLAKVFPVLGIKIDKASLKNISPRKQAIIFASGALASMISPITCPMYAILHLEMWIGAFLSIITAGNIVFTLIFSVKVGDLSRAKKALEVRVDFGK